MTIQNSQQLYQSQRRCGRSGLIPGKRIYPTAKELGRFALVKIELGETSQVVQAHLKGGSRQEDGSFMPAMKEQLTL